MKTITNADILAVIGFNTDSGEVKLTLKTSAKPADVNHALDQIRMEFSKWIDEIKQDYPSSYEELHAKLAEAEAEAEIIRLADEGEAPHQSQPPEVLAEEGEVEPESGLQDGELPVHEADNRPIEANQ